MTIICRLGKVRYHLVLDKVERIVLILVNIFLPREDPPLENCQRKPRWDMSHYKMSLFIDALSAK